MLKKSQMRLATGFEQMDHILLSICYPFASSVIVVNILFPFLCMRYDANSLHTLLITARTHGSRLEGTLVPIQGA